MRSGDVAFEIGLPRARRSGLWSVGSAALVCVACSSASDVATGVQTGGAGSGTGAISAAVNGGASARGGASSSVGGAHAGSDGEPGGAPASLGGSGAGGASSSAGAVAASGSLPAAGHGGTTEIGGALGRGGAGGAYSAGAGGASPGTTGPCDLYAAANTPCVAAHSTVRALSASYDGPLYQVRRASDKATKDVPVLSPGSFVDVAVQDTFCSGTTCTISVLYDQSPKKNDLVKSPVAHWLPNGGVEANAANAKITVSGHTAHGIYVTANSNVAYRNNSTKGVAKGDEPEAMYMLVDGKRFNDSCCFDYGNAETSGNDDGNGTMEALQVQNP